MSKQQSPQKDSHTLFLRVPKSLHESLKEEAWRRKQSLNVFCTRKLLESLNEQSSQQRSAG